MTNDEYQALRAIDTLRAHGAARTVTDMEIDLALALYHMVVIVARDSRIVTEALQQYRAWLREEEA